MSNRLAIAEGNKRRPPAQQQDKEEEPTKGLISISSCYTVCHLCGNILIRTFVESNDISRALEVYVICRKCITTLPEVVQQRLKHPATPKIYR